MPFAHIYRLILVIGLIVSMALGYLFGCKQYNKTQLVAALIVTAGVITTTTSKTTSAASYQANTKEYALGVTCLALSLLGSGVLGLYQERTFTKYGPHWKEDLRRVAISRHFTLEQYNLLWAYWTPRGTSIQRCHPSRMRFELLDIHNTFRLQQVSSVTTNLVLTARKAASLCLSIWWFGSGISTRLAIGATCVFAGTVLYAQASSQGKLTTAQPTPADPPSDGKLLAEKSESL
ncbi:UAA domain-containing protein [Rhizoctonia solani AG-1 IA]|uniref:UAA domain-containing protein n=1 Tax=Thanatephorus cucumeris (strain AG1-IA) TaxID=983506 RepID=L8X5C2_THACA|nr:UAA domain-containing protein [Rhizoctonia solani AG-1 IA]